MKKVFAALAAVVIMAFSAVPAFAISVNSPVATTEAETQPTTSKVNKDTTSVSPKTGSDNIALYSAFALAATACGAAAVFAVKKAKK